MREFINIVRESASAPYIDAHLSGNTVVIDMMWVPPEQRGKGVGRGYYEQWESELPSHVKYVKIWAADTGEGKSNQFWEQLGFEYMFAPGEDDDYNEDDDHWWWMIKGVNGNPTPPTKKASE